MDNESDGLISSPSNQKISTQQPPQRSKHGVLLILLLIIFVTLFGVLIYAMHLRSLYPDEIYGQVKTYTPSITSRTYTDETASWKTYNNEKYHFSFQYPPDWEVEAREPMFAEGDIRYAEKVFQVTLSKNGYTLGFDYPETEGGEALKGFVRKEKINIDGQVFTKLYINTIANCSSIISQFPTPPECNTSVSTIFIVKGDPQENETNGIFKLNNKNAMLFIRLPKAMNIGDKDLAKYDQIFDKVLSSMHLPTI